MENLKVLFPVHIRKKIKNNLWLNDLEEIRIRAGQPIELAYSGKTRYLTDMDGEMCACVRESVQNASMLQNNGRRYCRDVKLYQRVFPVCIPGGTKAGVYYN